MTSPVCLQPVRAKSPLFRVTARPPSSSDAAKRTFWSDQTGSLTVFTVILLIMMMVMGGMAVDFIRHENSRADLQNAIDRGSLATTNLRETLKVDAFDDDGNPITLTTNESAAALMQPYLNARSFPLEGETFKVEVKRGSLGERIVFAEANQPVPTTFLRMVQINQLDVNVAAAATEGVQNTEISLILDVSNSMSSRLPLTPGETEFVSKIQELRSVAEGFVKFVLDEDGEGTSRTLVSLIPYSGNVALPPELSTRFNITADPGNTFSTCLTFDSYDYNTTEMPLQPLLPYRQSQEFITAFANPTFQDPPGATGEYRYGCPRQNNAIVPLTNDADELVTAIRGLRPEMWTATWMGVKWGAAMLDPSTRPIVDSRIASNKLPDTFRGAPRDWDDPDVRKVVIIMSDGRNTRHRAIRDPHYLDNGGAQFFHTTESLGVANPYSSIVDNVVAEFRSSGAGDGLNQADSLFQDTCDMIKAQATEGVEPPLIFTIGFQLSNTPAGNNARKQLGDCASVDSETSTFFDVGEGLTLKEAFAIIANQITALQLRDPASFGERADLDDL